MTTLELQPADTALVDSLRDLQRACSTCNKHEQAIVLIHACIDAGRNTHAGIMYVMHALGWDLKHAQIVLDKSAGRNPALHRWQRDEEGTYRNHP